MSIADVVEGRVGEWMQVASGRKFFPQDPRPEEIKINDIANGLALTCRYGGQGNVDKFYSVAEHSLLMARYTLQNRSGNSYNMLSLALAVLMHDAAEAYAGDLIRSIKSAVRDAYAPLEDNIQEVILKKYGLLQFSLNWAQTIKEIDNRIVVNEKAVLFNSPQDWAADTLVALPRVEIKCYDPPTAKKMFLILFYKLMSSRE